MKNLEIVFTKSIKKVNFLSKLIMLYTKKQYSHVARKNSISHQPIYYHAAEGKVHYVNESCFIEKNKIIKKYTLSIPTSIYEEMEQESWKQVGKSYGTLQNIGILIVDLLQKLNIKATNPFKKGLNCSELIYRTVLQKLIPNLPYRADLIKPHQIEEIIINHNLDKNNID